MPARRIGLIALLVILGGACTGSTTRLATDSAVPTHPASPSPSPSPSPTHDYSNVVQDPHKYLVPVPGFAYVSFPKDLQGVVEDAVRKNKAFHAKIKDFVFKGAFQQSPKNSVLALAVGVDPADATNVSGLDDTFMETIGRVLGAGFGGFDIIAHRHVYRLTAKVQGVTFQIVTWQQDAVLAAVWGPSKKTVDGFVSYVIGENSSSTT